MAINIGGWGTNRQLRRNRSQSFAVVLYHDRAAGDPDSLGTTVVPVASLLPTTSSRVE